MPGLFPLELLREIGKARNLEAGLRCTQRDGFSNRRPCLSLMDQWLGLTHLGLIRPIGTKACISISNGKVNFVYWQEPFRWNFTYC